MTFNDKREITAGLIASLKAEAESHRRALRAAQAAATDPDSKAENKYDTRTLEASYLARGTAVRVVETERALAEWEALPPRDFSAMLPAGPGALVMLENARGGVCCLIGPGGGGLTVVHAGVEVLVITPASPLGRQLMNRREGEVFLLESGSAGKLETVITLVC